MRRIFRELCNINWDDSEWRKIVADVLLSCGSSLPEMIAEYMRSWEPEIRVSMMDASHETSSHYKWLIYRSYIPRYTIWLHDYKSSLVRGPGYAQVPHNHRYDLCSILLRGSYESVWYDVDEQLAEVRRQTLVAGDILSMGYSEVHSLTNIFDETQSFFIEGPARRNFSTSFPSGKEPQVWVDFDGRWTGMLDRLARTRRQSPT